MKRIICTAFIICSVTAITLAETPWEAYLAFPTPENASRVNRIEYTPGAISEKYGYWALDLGILRNQVLGGDREAFRLAYRLRQNADGGLLEELTMVLSRVIRTRPDFFLEEMSTLRPDRTALEVILLMPGLEYVDRLEARRYEILMRRKALAAVSHKSLRAFRDTCLEIMKEP